VQEHCPGADPRKRASRDEQPAAELSPRKTSVEPATAPLPLDHAVGIDNLTPGDDIAQLRERLQRERYHQPLPTHAPETFKRLRQAWSQPQQQEGSHAEYQEPQRVLL